MDRANITAANTTGRMEDWTKLVSNLSCSISSLHNAFTAYLNGRIHFIVTKENEEVNIRKRQ